MVEGETLPVRPGMCFSVEPSIYVPGQLGIRIEDIVTVLPDGSGRRLNQTPHEMQVVSQPRTAGPRVTR